MSEKIVQLNEEIIKGQIRELVRGSVEETLNELLEKEAESLTQAARYERSEARRGYRSSHYDRNYHDLRRRYAPYAAAQGSIFRNCHHRAVSLLGFVMAGRSFLSVDIEKGQSIFSAVLMVVLNFHGVIR